MSETLIELASCMREIRLATALSTVIAAILATWLIARRNDLTLWEAAVAIVRRRPYEKPFLMVIVIALGVFLIPIGLLAWQHSVCRPSLAGTAKLDNATSMTFSEIVSADTGFRAR